jgi:putative transposase
VENSWFLTRFHSRLSKNSLLTCLPSFTSFPVDCTDSESTGLRSRKIRIYPDFEQRRILRHWFGVSRYVYNKTIEYLKEPGTKANWMEIKLWLLKDLPEWCDGVPFQVKAIAVRDACQAVKNAKARWKRERKYSEVKYRSKKNPSQTIFIPKSAMNPTKGPYYTMLGEMHFSEVVPAPQGDCRLTYRSGRWFVTVPVETATKTAESQGRVVSIDPGVRTFATFYSPDCCGKIGTGDFSRIQRLCHHLDDLLSRTRKEKNRNRRYRMKKAQARMRWKIKDLIDELHHKAALFFVRNFDVILIPKFETSQMSRRGYRKIRAKSVRSMLTFAHYRFQEFLKFKAWEYDKVVVHVNEAYTSKTCSWNGKIKKIGGAKFIRDNGVVVDRDYNGARGIFLRGLCEIQPSLEYE